MSSPPRKPSAIADPLLGADRALALTHVPVRHRAAIAALWAVDAAMGDVLRTTSDPLLGQIRLAWWRERLEELDEGVVPAEPRLRAVARQLVPQGVSGRDVAVLEGAWLRLFDDFPWDIATVEGIWFRGRHLFGLAARVLGQPGQEIEAAGGLWALVDAARHCSDAASRALLVAQAKTLGTALERVKFTAKLRPLSALAVLAWRDAHPGEPFQPEGTPQRAALMLMHRVTGRIG
jgi:15-cis-phytoene synthase